VKRHSLSIVSVVLAVVVLAPLLAPGYVLHLDMVFVPHQSLLPWNLGIGGGLPRSVPQDAIVALIAGPLPGQLLQKAVLLATFVLAGVGAGRLAGKTLVLQLPAASLYVWSAYMAGRLLMGHWALLWAYALLPWAVLAARHARRTGRWAPVAVVAAAGALVPTGGIVLAVAAVPLAVGFGSRMRNGSRWLLLGTVVLLNAPWWLPAIRSPVTGASDPLGLLVFGARADGTGGVLLSLMAGGGVWNSLATLGSRTTWFAAAGTVVIVVLAVLGWRPARKVAGPEIAWMTVLGVTGLAWAWLTGVAADQTWAQSVVTGLPGGGLLRDGQKWTVFWVLLLAICAPHGLAWLTRSAPRALALFLSGALALTPLAVMPDFAWGGFGRLKAATYPAAWNQLRQYVAEDGRHGDVLSLPWTAFRAYAWNHGDVVLDPMPRYLTTTVVWNDQLPVTVDDRLVEVGGDDPRAAAVSQAIQRGEALVPALQALGVRWVVEQTDQPQLPFSADLTGTEEVWTGEDLRLLEVPGAVADRQSRDMLVVIVDVIALIVFAGLGVVSWRSRQIRSPRP
jgi:hypothetical protein